VPGAGMKSDQTAGNSDRDPVRQKIVHIQPIFLKPPKKIENLQPIFFIKTIFIKLLDC